MKKTPVLITALLALAACDNGTAPGAGTSVSLTLATNAPAGAAAAPGLAAAPARATITDGTNTLVITSARVVLREIEIEPVEAQDCNVEPRPAGCEEFEIGPVLLNLPVDGSTSQEVTIDVPAGSYDEVEFDIHVPSDADTAFLAANPGMNGKSIVVEGTYNGDAFVFETNMSQEQEQDLSPPLVVGDGDPATNVTIRFDLSTWFLDQQGNLFDPATASTGEPNESVAEENIQNSIKAFEDRDRDGDETDES